MSRFHHVPSDHHIRVRREFNTVTLRHDLTSYTCFSTWDMHYPGSRLRTERSTRTVYHDVKQARRWARKYGITLDERPENVEVGTGSILNRRGEVIEFGEAVIDEGLR